MLNSLRITPLKSQFSIAKGGTTEFTLHLTNEGSEPVVGTLSVKDFVVPNKTGQPVFLSSAQHTKFSGKDFVNFPQSPIYIAGHDTTDVLITLSVPEQAAAGEFFAAVFFTPKQDSVAEQSQVSITSSLGTLLSVRVPGEVKEGAIISRLNVPSFNEYGPLPITADITNTGEYAITPQGILTVRSLFGNLVEQQALPPQNIFPESTREYTIPVGTHWMFGRYTVTMNVAYGEHGKALSRSVVTWVLPWKIIIVCILSAILLMYLFKKLMVTMSLWPHR